MVLGIIGLSLFGSATIVFLILALVLSPWVFWVLFFCFGGASAISCALTTTGASKRKLARRMRNYYTVLEVRKIMSYEDIAAEAGRSARLVRKDIRDARRKKMAPDLWTDEEESKVILGREKYQRYLESEKDRKRHEEEEKDRARRLTNPATAPLEEFRGEGAAAILQLHIANEAIPEAEVKEKLSRLEEVTSSIFDYVEKHPERLPDVRKFMQYYLPATLQLLEKYQQYGGLALQPANVQNTRKEIETALDMIGVSFGNLLDSLYHYESLDVRTDIEVLENLLKQEGLTGNQFEVSAKK